MSCLFYAFTTGDEARWVGPFDSVKALVVEAYARRSAVIEGVYIASGRRATPEEKVFHRSHYTVDGRPSYFAWPEYATTAKPQCQGKNRYARKVLAIEVIGRALCRRKNRPKHLRAYHCPLCNGWHLTKTESHDRE